MTVRARTSPADPVEANWLRTTYDPEPVLHAMQIERTEAGAVWWEGALAIHNPPRISAWPPTSRPPRPRLDAWALATE